MLRASQWEQKGRSGRSTADGRCLPAASLDSIRITITITITITTLPSVIWWLQLWQFGRLSFVENPWSGALRALKHRKRSATENSFKSHIFRNKISQENVEMGFCWNDPGKWKSMHISGGDVKVKVDEWWRRLWLITILDLGFHMFGNERCLCKAIIWGCL